MPKTILNEIRLEVNASNVLMKNMIAEMKEIIDVMDKRAERHYFDTYQLQDKIRSIEEYLGIRLEEGGVKTKTKYLKIK